MTDKKPAEEAAREFRKSGKGGNGCPCDEVHTMDIELAALMTTREAELRAEVERLRKQNHEAAGERDKRYAAEMKELGHCRSLLREAKEMHEADMARQGKPLWSNISSYGQGAAALLIERAKKAEAALAEAAREINCAGPVAHRIRILKQEHATALTDLQGKFADQNLRLGEARGLLERWVGRGNSDRGSADHVGHDTRAFLAKKAEPAAVERIDAEHNYLVRKAEPAKEIVTCGNCNRDVIFVEPGK